MSPASREDAAQPSVPSKPSIVIVTPAGRGSLAGNRVSALRYARLLRGLGCRTRVQAEWRGERANLLIVLNAQRSSRSVLRARKARPAMPIVVVVTGTDVYRHLGKSRRMSQALGIADRIVGLQSDSVRILPKRFAAKARAILQSYDGPLLQRRISGAHFDFLVLGHLRPEKDPFRAALATRRLPVDSRIRVQHAGMALSAAMEKRARKESAANPRYRWIGALPRHAALRLLAKSQALILSSRVEGGPGVFSEALALGVPILASRIAASESILSARHPGLFTLGSSAELAALMRRVELEPRFRSRLAAASRKLAPRFAPALEQRAWRILLRELLAASRFSLPSRGVQPAHRGRAIRRKTAAAGR